MSSVYDNLWIGEMVIAFTQTFIWIVIVIIKIVQTLFPDKVRCRPCKRPPRVSALEKEKAEGGAETERLKDESTAVQTASLPIATQKTIERDRVAALHSHRKKHREGS
jgi:hypothetical protein